MISAAMDEAGLPFSALGRIAVTIGPGSFAGTRIGLSVARAMSLALGIPIVGMTSLEAVAGAISEPVPRIVAFDARKRELYLQVFDADLRPHTEPLAAALDNAAQALTRISPDSVIIGSGASALAPILGMPGAVRPPLWPDAKTFVALAARRAPAIGSVPSPLYLRAPGAKPYRRMDEA